MEPAYLNNLFGNKKNIKRNKNRKLFITKLSMAMGDDKPSSPGFGYFRKISKSRRKIWKSRKKRRILIIMLVALGVIPFLYLLYKNDEVRNSIFVLVSRSPSKLKSIFSFSPEESAAVEEVVDKSNKGLHKKVYETVSKNLSVIVLGVLSVAAIMVLKDHIAPPPPPKVPEPDNQDYITATIGFIVNKISVTSSEFKKAFLSISGGERVGFVSLIVGLISTGIGAATDGLFFLATGTFSFVTSWLSVSIYGK